MNWIPLVATSLLTPLLTGIIVYFVQLRWQERMEQRLTRYSKLHEKRAEVIAELHSLLVEMRSDLHSAALAVSPSTEGWPEEEIQRRVEAAHQSAEAFREHFRRHRIYLPESLVVKISRFCAQTFATSLGMQLTDASRTEALQDESQQGEYRKLWEETSEEVSKRIPSLRQDIEAEFRRLLGS